MTLCWGLHIALFGYLCDYDRAISIIGHYHFHILWLHCAPGLWRFDSAAPICSIIFIPGKHENVLIQQHVGQNQWVGWTMSSGLQVRTWCARSVPAISLNETRSCSCRVRIRAVQRGDEVCGTGHAAHAIICKQWCERKCGRSRYRSGSISSQSNTWIGQRTPAKSLFLLLLFLNATHLHLLYKLHDVEERIYCNKCTLTALSKSTNYKQG